MFIRNIFKKNDDKVTNYQSNDFVDVFFASLFQILIQMPASSTVILLFKDLEFEFSDLGGRWRRDSTSHYNRFFICFVFRFLQNNKVSYIEDGTFAHLMKNSLAL